MHFTAPGIVNKVHLQQLRKVGTISIDSEYRRKESFKHYIYHTDSGTTSGKEHACQSRRLKRYNFNPRVRKIPWKRAWQPTTAFLPGESHGQRDLEATVQLLKATDT